MVRTVDYACADDLNGLLRAFVRCDGGSEASEAALRVFLRAANTSVASALRLEPQRVGRLLLPEPGACISGDVVYLPDKSGQTLVQAGLSGSWRRISEDDVDRVRSHGCRLWWL